MRESVCVCVRERERNKIRGLKEKEKEKKNFILNSKIKYRKLKLEDKARKS